MSTSEETKTGIVYQYNLFVALKHLYSDLVNNKNTKGEPDIVSESGKIAIECTMSRGGVPGHKHSTKNSGNLKVDRERLLKKKADDDEFKVYQVYFYGIPCDYVDKWGIHQVCGAEAIHRNFGVDIFYLNDNFELLFSDGESSEPPPCQVQKRKDTLDGLWG